MGLCLFFIYILRNSSDNALRELGAGVAAVVGGVSGNYELTLRDMIGRMPSKGANNCLSKLVIELGTAWKTALIDPKLTLEAVDRALLKYLELLRYLQLEDSKHSSH